MTRPILVGAVLYDPKVSAIWDIIRNFFAENGCPIDVVFYTNYELQVEALLAGHHDIAWNSPLAWLDAQRRSGGRCRAIAMRDTDRDRVSHLVVKQDSGIEQLSDLKGRTVALGAEDSPQATLIPLGLLMRSGLDPAGDVNIRRFDLMVGKHGDHVGGELEAFRCLEAGEAQASAMIDLNWQGWTADGTIAEDRYRILATTDTFDHCVFTVREDFPADQQQQWLKVLFSMAYDNPKHREMMDLEGLKAWQDGRTSGFGPLNEAVNKLHYFERQSR
jgi:ABC-type phosphate/phosphonate transport system substrate-binding protein